MSVTATLIALSLAPAQAATVEVPFRLGDNAIIVNAKVNGRDLSFMFDTGYSGTVIVDSAINLGPTTGTITLRDFVGELQANTVKIRSFQMGGKSIDVKDLSDAVSRAGDYSFSYNTHVDGIMGFDAIKHSITEINFQQKKFIFHPSTKDITKLPVDGKKTFIARLLPIGGSSMEMAVETMDGKRMILALDTGNAFFATTHKEVIERIGVWKAGESPKYMTSAGVASGSVDTFYFQMPPLKIYGIPVEKSVWSIIDAPKSSAEQDGTIGFDFLKNFNITIDYDRRRVYFEHFTESTGNEPWGSVGIAAGYVPQRKRTLVFAVSPDSPAAVAGLKPGDEILSVDGNELIQAGYRRMQALLEGPVGSKVKLAVSRNGLLTRYELERKELINRPPAD